MQFCKEKGDNHMQQEGKSKKLKIITISVVSALFLVSVVLVVQFVSLAKLRNTQAELTAYLSQLEQNIETTSDENEYLASGEFVEDYAREVMGYATTGETRFR